MVLNESLNAFSQTKANFLSNYSQEEKITYKKITYQELQRENGVIESFHYYPFF